jgi:hypothetical protein
MRLRQLITVCVFIFICSVNAHAVDYDVQSRTYFQIRENADDDRLLPLHEYLDLDVNNIADKEISFHVGGWFRQDLNDNESFNERSSESDLQYGYVSFERRKVNGYLHLGRVPVYEGVATELVDGVALGTDLFKGLDISAYGGVPVETDFDERDGDSIYGGRVSHRFKDMYELGVSYLKEDNDGSDFREEAGVDVWLMPVNKLDITGRSIYNVDSEDWMEHAYYLTLGPFGAVRFGGEATWISYEDYFYAADSSAFIFRPDVLDAEEEVFILGGNVELGLTDKLSLGGDYKNYAYDIADSADYYGASIKYTDLTSAGAGASIHRMDGQIDRLKYNEYRIYVYKKVKKVDATLDLFDVQYDEEINGVEHAYTGVVAVGYEPFRSLRLACDLSYSENPEFEEDVRAQFKLIYRFQKRSGV